MLKSFIILFREGFEAFLIVFLVLGFLTKSGNTIFKRNVYTGALAAVIASFILGFAFKLLHLNFEGKTEYIFEGITMVVTSLLLAGMILWLVKFKVNTQAIRSEIDQHTAQNNGLGISLLVFFSIFREGVETVLFFLVMPDGASVTDNVIGGALGLTASFALCYAVFQGAIRLNFSLFFNVTTGLLLLIAAGLMAHGVHELVEAEWIPALVDEVWNWNPEPIAEGVYPALHEKGSVGSLLKAILGYNGNPTLVEVLAYFAYLLTVGFMWFRFEQQHKNAVLKS